MSALRREGLVEQRHDGDGRGLAHGEVLLEVAERHAAVEDVLDDDDVLPGYVAGEVLVYLDRAGGSGPVAVGGDGP